MAAADPVPTDARERRDVVVPVPGPEDPPERAWLCLLYTSDAADDAPRV